MRIYSINIDAAPLFPEVGQYLESAGFRRMYFLVNGLFTSASINSSYYGKVFDLIADGDDSLVDILLKENFSILLHEDGNDFVRNSLNEEPGPGTLTGNECRLADSVPNLKNERYAKVILSANQQVGDRHKFVDSQHTAAFLRREEDRLKSIQSRRSELFAYVLYAQYHDFVYYYHKAIEDTNAYLDHISKSTTAWLRLWNFSQPEALFFVFSDHGDFVDKLNSPKDYLRW